MDHIRQELDQLMGKDRNRPLYVRLARRDHFDDSGICKFNLISFCPNDLFPNTKDDIGPCEKRHDDFLKDQFLNDEHRDSYERKYQDELISLLTKMIAKVDYKIQKSLQRAENGP
jgi:RNA-binding protein Luc7-like 2